MKTFFKSIDYFSREFVFTYKGKDRYKTVLGGTVTILSLCVIILNAWLIGKDIYLRENPIVLGYDEALPFYPTTKVNYHDIFFAYFISDTLNNPIEDESLLKIIPLIYTNYYDKHGNLKYKEKFLELTDCQSEFKKLNLTAPLTEAIFSPIKCIKDFNEVLAGFWTDTHLSYLMFKVYKCTNETIVENTNLVMHEEFQEFDIYLKNISSANFLVTNNNQEETNQESISISSNTNNNIDVSNNNKNNNIEKKPKKTICKSDEEIKKVIPTLFFNFFYTSIIVNTKNFTTPMTQQINEDWFNLGTFIFKTIDYYFQNIVIRTDEGIIFSKDYKDINSVGYYKHLADSRSLEEGDSNIFWLNIYISNQVKYYTREYLKLQNIFANLGGIIQVVLLFFKLIFSPYFQKKLNLKIINELYDFDDEISNEVLSMKVLRKRNIKHIDSLILTNTKLKKKMANFNLNNSTNNSYLLNSNTQDQGLLKKLSRNHLKENLNNNENNRHIGMNHQHPESSNNNYESNENHITRGTNKFKSVSISKYLNKSNKSLKKNLKNNNKSSIYKNYINSDSVKKINKNKEKTLTKHDLSTFKNSDCFINQASSLNNYQNFKCCEKSNNYSCSGITLNKKPQNKALSQYQDENNKFHKVNHPGTVSLNLINLNKEKNYDANNPKYKYSRRRNFSDYFSIKNHQFSTINNLNITNNIIKNPEPVPNIYDKAKVQKIEIKSTFKQNKNSLKNLEKKEKILQIDNEYEKKIQNEGISKNRFTHLLGDKEINVIKKSSSKKKLKVSHSDNCSEYKQGDKLSKCKSSSFEHSVHTNNNNSNLVLIKQKIFISPSSPNFNKPSKINSFGNEESGIKDKYNNITSMNLDWNSSSFKNNILPKQVKNKKLDSFINKTFEKKHSSNDKSSSSIDERECYNANTTNNEKLACPKELNRPAKEDQYSGLQRIVRKKSGKEIINQNLNNIFQDTSVANRTLNSKKQVNKNKPSNRVGEEGNINSINNNKHNNNHSSYRILNKQTHNNLPVNSDFGPIKDDNISNYHDKINFSQSLMQSKIEGILNFKRNKLKLKNSEIFNNFYCYIFCNSRRLKEKNKLYIYALENLNQYTDYLANIKNFQDIRKMKYLLFNTEQIMCFPFLSNPKKYKLGIEHDIQEYAKAFDSSVQKKEVVKEIFNYFNRKIHNNTLDGFDKKIWNIFDSNMKNLFVNIPDIKDSIKINK